MRKRITVVSGVFIALFGAGAAAAMPMDMTVDRLLNICEAPNVQAAIVKGGELGWQQLTDAEMDEWRTNFVAYNGGSVEIVGWRRENAGANESLSFWVAVGPNGHKACVYSSARPAGLLDALSGQLGAPDYLDKNDAAELTSASWKRGAVEYSFTQAGSSAIIAIGPSQ